MAGTGLECGGLIYQDGLRGIQGRVVTVVVRVKEFFQGRDSFFPQFPNYSQIRVRECPLLHQAMCESEENACEGRGA